MNRYPKTSKGTVVDDYHGVSVPDPYRWLEDTEAQATFEWVEDQNAVTERHLGGIANRQAVRDRVAELWDYTRYGTPAYPVPVLAGGFRFFFRNDGLQNQPVLFVEPEHGEARVLMDPNTLSDDGTVALSSFDVTHDGRLLAYALAHGGSDWQEIRVRDVETGNDLPDHVQWMKFASPSWTRDGRGFFYSRYPEPDARDALLETNRGQQLYYHRLGTDQSQDVLIYERPEEPDWGFVARVTDDGRYAVIHVWHGSASENRLYYLDLGDPANPVFDAEVRPIMDHGDASYLFVANLGERFLVLTDLDAPRRRVVAVDLHRPEPEHWESIIPEDASVLESVRLLGGRLVAAYLADARGDLRVHGLDGTQLPGIALPTLGSVAGFGGSEEKSEMFFSFTSFVQPRTVYRHDLDSGETDVFGTPLDFDVPDLVTRQVFVASKDGTRVPMFVTHRRGISKDGDRPVMLYGYGGFNVSLSPFFSVPHLVWMEMGGVLAVPNLRGGGEYGEEWHRAGTRERKQNVFDDFQAAATHLIETGYTRPERIAIAGGSNGGLLVGACMIQRPDLFAVALPAVGVMDMLRFHRFTIGWAWVSDYGSADEPEDFAILHAYSPLHSLKDGQCYPATLVTTADRDDRVVPGHSFKFTARLQEAQGCDRPALIRVDRQAGHGAGKPTRKLIDEAGDRLAFAWHHLGQGT
jgi:prolyl oligopeptidase